MKKIVYLIILSFIFLPGNPCRAQFGKLKKLKKEAEKTVKSTEKKADNSKTEKDVTTKKASFSSSESSESNVVKYDEEYKKFVSSKYHTAYYLGEYPERYGSEQLYQEALELDYPATYKCVKEKGLQNANENHYNILIEFKDKIPAMIDNHVQPEIKKYIAEAYKEKGNNNTQKAVLNLDVASKYANAVLLLDPENEKGLQLNSDIKKAQTDIAADYYARLYTSDFHKTNKGKILFSSQPVTVRKEDPSRFKTKFTGTDKIYGIVYLDGYAGTVQNSLTYFTHDETGGYYVDVDNGVSDFNIRVTHDKNEMKKSYLLLEIIPDAGKATNTQQAVDWIEQLAGLSPSSHTLKIGYHKGNTDIHYAIGEIELDWSTADITKLKENAKLAVKNAKDNKAKMAELPEQFSYSSGHFYDPKLSTANIKSLLKNKWDNCATITQLIIEKHDEGDEYMIYKDFGVPDYKSTRVPVHAVYKGKDGWCYYVTDIHFRREYSGAGNYSAPLIDFEREHIKIDCGNIK